MPIVTVQLFPGRTTEQKREMAKEITDAVVRIAKTTPEATHVIFQDVSQSDWAEAGTLMSEK